MKRRIVLIIATLTMQASGALLAGAQQIAFTWDDLPAHGPLPPGISRTGVAGEILEAMKNAHMPAAYGFINGSRTEIEKASIPVLAQWRAAGLPLGNHTWSHLNLSGTPLPQWEADVLKNEPLLQAQMGSEDWHWLRFPFLAEGDSPDRRDPARRFLAEHGYRIAAVTMSFRDYLFNPPYARCMARNDAHSVALLEDDYLSTADATLTYARSMARTLYGHDIPYVLLMHIGAMDAHMLPKLLALYQSKGFSFVSLQQAESDPFYKNDLDLSLPADPDTFEAALRARHLPVPRRPDPSLNLDTLCK